MKEVAELENLTYLDLSDTQITDVGLKELAVLKKLTGLSLFGTRITKAGVDELQKALPKCRIFQ
jgi:Leucine-rich repeat (LRR) protein